MREDNQNLYLSIGEFSKLTSRSPMVIHLNPSGLIRLGSNNKIRFERFRKFLITTEKLGGNILIPSFSYSFVGEESIYDVYNTPCTLENISENLRKLNPEKRSFDPMFSYLMYGNFFHKRHKEVHNIDTFGKGSLIDDIFKVNGYLCAIGGVLEHLTELHYIENMLGVDYRNNKKFFGKIIDCQGLLHEQTCTFFCRDLDSDYSSSFLKFKKDIRSSKKLINIYVDEYRMRLEAIRFKDCYEFLKLYISMNSKYCWSTN